MQEPGSRPSQERRSAGVQALTKQQKTQQPAVEIFVLCYNRLDFVEESIRSALNQDYPNVKVIVSDNSTIETVSEQLKKAFPDLEIRRRRPSQTPYVHLNTVFSEATAPYFIVFHDDDVMAPNFISDLVPRLEADPKLCAASPNAQFIHGTTRSNELFNSTLKEDLVLKTPKDLAVRYLDFALGVNPFPGYLYRRSAIDGLRFDPSVTGQYADMAFLIQMMSRGHVLWFATPLMFYRKHGGNASAAANLKSARKMTRFLEQEGIFPRGADELRLFRYWNHFFFMKNSKKKPKRLRKQQAKLVAAYFMTHPASLLKRILQKLASH